MQLSCSLKTVRHVRNFVLVFSFSYKLCEVHFDVLLIHGLDEANKLTKVGLKPLRTLTQKQDR